MRYIYVLTIIILASCSDPVDSEMAVSANAHEPAFIAWHDMSETGLPITVLNDDPSIAPLQSVWNATFGRVELSNGDGLSMYITRDTTTCAARKQELAEGVFETTYVVETDTLIFYESGLPGGSNSYFHFFASFELKNERYTFENNPLIEFSEAEIRQMVYLVQKAKVSTTQHS